MSKACDRDMCILGMPHIHEDEIGAILYTPGGHCRRLSKFERFLWRNFWIEPKEMRGA